MCGIVGILGSRPAAPVLLESLGWLEYRGYDSAGITTLQGDRFERRRAVGKLRNLSELIERQSLRGTAGIGHTRWATHGAATVENAHPHQSESVSIVHNGIIENFRDLRSDLIRQGYRFKSETDTETALALCQRFIDENVPPVEAARSTLKLLEGNFALLFLFRDEDDLLVAARRGSPLVIGHGDGEMFVASDEIALSGLTDSVTYLEDGDCASINRHGLQIADRQGHPVQRDQGIIRTCSTTPSKDGHPHYMIKEILEQPAVLEYELDQYLPGAGKLRLPVGCPDFCEVDRIVLVACGTAKFACETAAYWFERLARIPAHAEIASEFRYRNSVLDSRTLAILVSQSGETADTLAALRHARDSGCPNIAILNVASSSMSREADSVMPIHAGVEIGVASTKAFNCQLAALAILAIAAAESKASLEPGERADLIRQLRQLPGLATSVLELNSVIPSIASELAGRSSALFIGRGTMYPVALEGALKLKELSYIHAEGIASGELKHGTIALVDEDLPIVVLAPRDQLLEKTLSNLEEVRARQGRVILVSDQATAGRYLDGVWFTVVLPDVDTIFAPLLYSIPLQLLAYHTAVAAGTDVDQPRNLAKSVTVE